MEQPEQQPRRAPAMVTKCLCFDVTFETLNEAAQRDNLTLEQLQEQFRCGRGCGLCIPYIRTMLRTGETQIRLGDGTPEPRL